MLKVGLTGGIGSGKTTVSNLFSDLNIPVIDTDIIARETLADKHVFDTIRHIFGEDILNGENKLNRKALAQLVFNDTKNKQKLEDVLHPRIHTAVSEKTNQLIAANPAQPYIIIVIPLLIETNFSQIINRVLVVMAEEEIRIKRIKQRDDRNMNEIRAIISTQASDQQRIDAADDIIKNNNNINELSIQVQALHEQYLSIAESIK